MGTIIRKCEFGIEHSRSNCRCTDTHVTVRQMRCNVPDEHRQIKAEFSLDDITVGEPTSTLTDMTLRDRLSQTVEGWFGHLLAEGVRDRLLDKLEQDVKDWLQEAALKELR